MSLSEFAHAICGEELTPEERGLLQGDDVDKRRAHRLVQLGDRRTRGLGEVGRLKKCERAVAHDPVARHADAGRGCSAPTRARATRLRRRRPRVRRTRRRTGRRGRALASTSSTTPRVVFLYRIPVDGRSPTCGWSLVAGNYWHCNKDGIGNIDGVSR